MRRGLFSRLDSGARAIDPTESILAHLQVLLNSKSIVDLTDLAQTLPRGMRGVEAQIREAIERYEPRLCHVSVRHVPSDEPLRLDFAVQARLAAEPQRALRFRTWVRMPGRFQLGG